MSKLMGATLAALALGLAVAGASARADEMTSGEQLFRSKGCATCHSVAAAGIEAKVKKGPLVGPELPEAIAGQGGDWVRDFLKQRVAAADGKKHRKAFKGSDEELSALVQWLLSLPSQRS
jgi:mono/diheme cytochrome c family protein